MKTVFVFMPNSKQTMRCEYKHVTQSKTKHFLKFQDVLRRFVSYHNSFHCVACFSSKQLSTLTLLVKT